MAFTGFHNPMTFKKWLEKTAWIGALLFMLPAQALEIRGTVFEDANGNGVRDAAEPGLPGIQVSNGREIVRTDDRGRYRIEIDDRRGHVMVLKPAGFALPRNALGLPEYYWLHYPQGSPERRHAGIAPTGPVPELVDFALIATEEPENLRILAIADPQTTNHRELGYFERMFTEELRALEDVDFALLLGDLLNDALNLAEPFDRIVANFGHPWVAVIGNHDLDLDADSDFGAADTFTARYGPSTWAFEYGPAHFLVLDNIRFHKPPSGRYEYTGGFRTEQLDFIQHYLAELPQDSMIILAMHIPLASVLGHDTFRNQDRARLLEMLAPFEHVLALAGHSHSNYHLYLDQDDGWPGPDGYLHQYVVGTASGSWWGGALDDQGLPESLMRDGTPQGYAIIDLARTGYSIEYRAVGQPDRAMALFGPGSVLAGTFPNAFVYANVFNGDRYTQVDYRVERLNADAAQTIADWTPMRKVDEPDPRVLQRVIQRAQFEGRPDNARLSPPFDSTHLWRARLSTDVDPGMYRISVRARDRWGMDAVEFTDFRVYAMSDQD